MKNKKNIMLEVNEFRPKAKGLAKVLGPLEADILEVIWETDSKTAREVYEVLKKKRKGVRRSTVSIMMNRLEERGFLEKKIGKGRGGLKYIFKTKISRNDFEHLVAKTVLNALFETFERATKDCLKDMKF